jgi:hypothetical protein
MSEMETALLAWHDFYIATAGASAVLLGLVFVGLTIHIERRGLRGPLRGLAVGSATNLVYALFTSFALLIPQGVPYVQGVALLLIGLLGIISAEAAFVDARRGTAPRIGRVVLVFQFGLPLVAIGLLLVAGIGFLLAVESALWAAGAVVFVLIAIGTQSAWDLLFRYAADDSLAAGQPGDGADGART